MAVEMLGGGRTGRSFWQAAMLALAAGSFSSLAAFLRSLL